MRSRRRGRLDPARQGSGAALLTNNVNSWFTGMNTNVEGKQTRMIVQYRGGVPVYRARCDEVAAKGYKELLLG